MQNEAGEYVDMYIPRKWLGTRRRRFRAKPVPVSGTGSGSSGGRNFFSTLVPGSSEQPPFSTN